MRMRIALVAIVAVAVAAAGASPAPTAAAGSQYVTRAQYVQQLLQAVGTTPMPGAAQTFRDVPPGSPYFGWVEAAYHAGITTGMSPGYFGPNEDLNRAEAAAFDLRAYSPRVANWAKQNFGLTPNNQFGNTYQGKFTGDGESQGFSDDSAIPKALVSDVGLATTIGLLHGFPNGTFGPLDTLTKAQSQDLINQLEAVLQADGPWRFFSVDALGAPDPSPLGTLANEQAAVGAADVGAGIVTGEPFSAVKQYVATADLPQVEQEYNQVQSQFQSKDVPSGVAWRVLGLAFEPGVGTNVGIPMLLIQSYATASGAPVVLPQPLWSPAFGFYPQSVADVAIEPGVEIDATTGLVTSVSTRWGILDGPQSVGAVNGFNPVLHPTEATDIMRAQLWPPAFEAINASGN